ncbi:hypothetical protein [Halosegnis longus]|uniref:Uncharacterized protein n=2 Tax=Halosegnis longus TaxID=2216012 RepID=A0AAJ4R8R0_9EURY|nr:hypothetical protein [Salella cibi]RNJ26389.1 hypothetical protein Nmn1133_06725 [Salella cibi]
MPSSKRIYIVTGMVLFGVAALVYAWALAYEPLLGTGVAVAAFIAALLTYYGDANRQTLARVTIVVTIVYGTFTFQLPIAVVAACIVYLTAWLTGTDSPFDAPDTQIFPINSTATDDSGD